MKQKMKQNPLAVLLRTSKKSKLKPIQKLESQETELNSNKN